MNARIPHYAARATEAASRAAEEATRRWDANHRTSSRARTVEDDARCV